MKVLTIIKLEQIDLEDRRFCFTLSRAEERFLHSVKEAGIVQPVLVIKRQGRLVVVSGWRRIQAARVCRLKELAAVELEEELTDLEVMKLIFLERYGQGRFSIAEKALAVRKFSDFGLSSEEIILRILPLLELPPEQPTLNILLKLSELPVGLEQIHRKDWKLSTVELFLTFPAEERLWLLSLTEHFTHNQQKEMIELFYSLKKKKKENLKELSGELGLAACLEVFQKDRLSAGDKLLSVLRKEVNPQVSRLNESISRTIKQLRLPERVGLDYDRTLEKNRIRLIAEARSACELKTSLSNLLESLNDEKWTKLFAFLNHKGQ
jgi:hypothetical protein